MSKFEFNVTNMDCPSCVAAVIKKIKAINGVSADVQSIDTQVDEVSRSAQFLVSGTNIGATVRIYADNTILIGSAVVFFTVRSTSIEFDRSTPGSRMSTSVWNRSRSSASRYAKRIR